MLFFVVLCGFHSFKAQFLFWAVHHLGKRIVYRMQASIQPDDNIGKTQNLPVSKLAKDRRKMTDK